MKLTDVGKRLKGWQSVSLNGGADEDVVRLEIRRLLKHHGVMNGVLEADLTCLVKKAFESESGLEEEEEDDDDEYLDDVETIEEALNDWVSSEFAKRYSPSEPSNVEEASSNFSAGANAMRARLATVLYEIMGQVAKREAGN